MTVEELHAALGDLIAHGFGDRKVFLSTYGEDIDSYGLIPFQEAMEDENWEITGISNVIPQNDFISLDFGFEGSTS